MKKKSVKSAKLDRWQGTMDERTATLIKTTEELKDSVKELHCNVDEKFLNLEIKIDSKFEKHNMHHEYIEKKYTKLFLVLGTLAITSCILNPESLKVLWGLIVKLIGIF